jgi:hypothetical protein
MKSNCDAAVAEGGLDDAERVFTHSAGEIGSPDAQMLCEGW